MSLQQVQWEQAFTIPVTLKTNLLGPSINPAELLELLPLQTIMTSSFKAMPSILKAYSSSPDSFRSIGLYGHLDVQSPWKWCVLLVSVIINLIMLNARGVIIRGSVLRCLSSFHFPTPQHQKCYLGFVTAKAIILRSLPPLPA